MASGARPVVVLGKADLCPDVDARLAEVQALARSLPVVTMALVSPDGHAGLLPFLRERETVALLGSSGVGKSTLLNRLAGTDLQRTKEVRAHDSRGRHTTTHAQLFALPGGALCIDTPGMRELQLWEEAGTGLGSAFEDVEAIAARCRFRDCRHGGEPGCAVREALEAGTLPQDRYDSFAKLSAEIAATRDDLGARQRRKQGERVVARARRKLKDDE
jgi:ribosome biogenesis GTPase